MSVSSERGGVIHIIDGSFDGLLTSVFLAFEHGRFPERVYENGVCQSSFVDIPVEIVTDSAKARSVLSGITRKLGKDVYEQVYMAYLSYDSERFSVISRFLTYAFKTGGDIMGHMAEKTVMDLFALCRNYRRETEKLLGFLRFSVMENGVQYAAIAPQNNQIPILMPHFCDRFPDIPFVIHDTVRQIAGVYDTRVWYMADADKLSPPGFADDELLYRELWKKFYDAIAIESRKNPKLQRQNLPLRYRRNMTEYQ
jgi:probable DNA metabolism protein